MNDLIKHGILKPGMELELTTDPLKSKAILIDGKFVDFNGEKMSFNDWGKLITGWVSIRIYSYVRIVGEKETLQDKRLRLMNEE